MKYVGYYNGEIGTLDEIKVPMYDRILYFGDASYEVCEFRNKRAFALRDHLNRFENSLRMLEINLGMSKEDFALEVQKVIDACEADHGELYWHASRGSALRGFAADRTNMKANILMYAKPAELVPFEQTYKLMSHEDIRFLHCDIKTVNLIPAVMYSYHSKEQGGCQESILHRGDRVTECGHSNVLILKDGVLCAPPKDNLILPGITMTGLLKIAENMGIPTRIAPFTMTELWAADEVIITSTGLFVVRGTELDGKPIGCKDEETFNKLQKAYYDYYIKNTDRTAIIDD